MHPAATQALPQALAYPAMRLRWCALALRDFLHRWAAYAVVGAAVAGAGAVGWQQIIAAVSAWFVMPLFYAASQGAWLALALPLQVLFGTGCVWAARNLLWPPRWAESERALPIPRALKVRSDVAVVLIALLPLLLVYGAGATTLLVHRTPWLLPVRALALAALLAAALLTLVSGVALLQQLRRAGLPAAPRPSADRGEAAPATAVVSPLHWPRALIVLPLWRGPARRTGFALAAGAALMLLPGAGALALRSHEPWCLAACALLALAVTTRVDALARIEFAELLQAAATLPLAAPPLQRARAALGLIAVVPGLVALAAAVQALHAPGLRPLVLWSWALAALSTCTFEVLSAPADPAQKSSRWLFSLVVCVCLATEVLA